MQTIHKIAIVGVSFAAGVWVGSVVLGQPSQVVMAKPEVAQPPTPAKTNSPQSFRTRRDSYSGFGQKYLSATDELRTKMLEGIPVAERVRCLEQILALSGPEGVPYELLTAIRSLVKSEMDRDKSRTLTFILAMEHIGNRDFLFEAALDSSESKEWAKRNFDQLLTQLGQEDQASRLYKSLIGVLGEESTLKAIQLSKKHCIGFDGKIDYPPGLLNSAAKQGWQATFEYFKDLGATGNRDWSAGGFLIPKDFDFRSFAQAWAAHERSAGLTDRDGFYEPPVYLWQEWAKRDPQAALDFLQSGATKAFHATDFFSSYIEVAAPKDIFTVAASLDNAMLASGVSNLLADELSEAPGLSIPFVEWMKESGDQTLTTAILKLCVYREDRKALGKSILAGLGSEERLAVVRDAFGYGRSPHQRIDDLPPERHEWITSSLRALGHSEHDISQLFGPAKK